MASKSMIRSWSHRVALFPHCSQLGRLKMGETQSRKIFIFYSKIAEFFYADEKFITYQIKGFVHDYDIRVVGDVAGGCSKWIIGMADGHCCPYA